MQPSITIEVTPDGKIKIEGIGFTGKACDEKMAAFEKELGKVEDRKNSPEYYATVSTQQKLSSR